MKAAFRLGMLAAACALAGVVDAQAPARTTDGVLTTDQGMTLYTFDKDTGGKSACNGPCVGLWPPHLAAGDAKPAGDWTLVTRDDGAKQWAYKGKPVYRWAKDGKAGDRTGDNFNNVWHVAKP